MLTYFKVSTIVMIALIYSGCTVKTNTYESHASAQYSSSGIKTDFIVIEDNTQKLNYEPAFGVVAAVDNDTLKYTLIAPYTSTYSLNELKELELFYAFALTADKSKELIAHIDMAVKNWDLPYEYNRGNNIEYKLFSKNNTLIFRYQNSSEGPLAILKLYTGRKFVVLDNESGSIHEKIFTYRIEKLEKLENFKDLLLRALQENKL